MLKKVVFGVATLLILQHIFKLVYLLGFNKRVYKHHPGPCRIIPGIDSGAEDIVLISNGLAFISSGLNPEHMGLIVDPVVKDHLGQIFLFDFKHPSKNVTNLKLTGEGFDIERFSPHGISAYEDKESGAVTIFVVNHRRDLEVIEVFQFDEKAFTLTHKKSVSDPGVMRSVNDVVAISEEAFYFTNDGYTTGFAARNIETMLILASGNVMYYDGQTMRKVVDRGEGCNGISVSPNYMYIYVSHPPTFSIHVYERLVDSSLKAVQVLDLGSSPDNIFVEPETGNLWIASHPIAIRLVEHFQNKSNPAPSQVLFVNWDDGNTPDKYDLAEVFSDTGKFLSGSTIAVHHEGALLIGTAISKLAFCQVIAF